MTPNDRLREEASNVAHELTQGGWTGDLDGTYQAILAFAEYAVKVADRAVDEALAELEEWCALTAESDTVGDHDGLMTAADEIARRRREMGRT